LTTFRTCIVLISLSVLFFNTSCSYDSKLSAESSSRRAKSENYVAPKFVNNPSIDSPTLSKAVSIIARMATKDRSLSVPSDDIPVRSLSREQLDDLDDDQLHIVKLGHSSILIKNEGEYWLIDPVFSNRVSPVSFAGPARFHDTPIALADLPPIDKVLISHNHYDHLDKATIKGLSAITRQFLVPLGVEVYLEQWGVNTNSIESFVWWQEYTTDDTRIVFTPAQHFSGRGLTDRDKSLWGSWVLTTQSGNLFFSGDSGYFKGYKRIGESYGPFDLTLIEVGAYSAQWPEVHMFPEQSLQAHLDVQGRHLLPVHNSTFDLAFHPWKEPLERITELAREFNVSVSTPDVGEVFTLENLPIERDWWRGLN